MWYRQLAWLCIQHMTMCDICYTNHVSSLYFCLLQSILKLHGDKEDLRVRLGHLASQSLLCKTLEMPWRLYHMHDANVHLGRRGCEASECLSSSGPLNIRKPKKSTNLRSRYRINTQNILQVTTTLLQST